jgi:hypothetical protein
MNPLKIAVCGAESMVGAAVGAAPAEPMPVVLWTLAARGGRGGQSSSGLR